jgi:hypothetical protein
VAPSQRAFVDTSRRISLRLRDRGMCRDVNCASILSARQYVELIRDNIALAVQLFQQENWPN